MIKNILKDSFIYGLSNTLSKFIAFLLIPVYTAIFSVEDYGTIGVLASIMGIIGIFMQLGSNNALQRFYFNEVNDEYRKVIIVSGLTILLVSSTSILIICLFFMNEIYMLLDKVKIPTILFIIALMSVYVSQFNIYTKEIMRVYFLPKKFFILEVFPMLVTILVTLTLLFTIEKSLHFFYLGLLIGSISGALLSLKYLTKIISLRYNPKVLKDMFSFGYPFIFVGLAYWVFQSSDRLMLLELSGKMEVGYYHIASQFSVIMHVVITAFGASWSPYAMKLYNEHLNHKYIFAKMATLWVLFLSMVTIVASAFAGDVLIFMTTEEYHDAGKIIPILIFGIFMFGTTQFTALGISIVKKTKLISKYSWITAILNIILNLLLIPYFDAIGAAIATSLSSVLLTLLYLKSSQKEYFIKYEYKQVFFIVFITFLLVALFVYLSIPIIVKLILIFIVLLMYMYIAKERYLTLTFNLKG